MAEGTGLEPYSPCQSLVRGQGGFQDVHACVDLPVHFPVAHLADEHLAHPISAPGATCWAGLAGPRGVDFDDRHARERGLVFNQVMDQSARPGRKTPVHLPQSASRAVKGEILENNRGVVRLCELNETLRRVVEPLADTIPLPPSLSAEEPSGNPPVAGLPLGELPSSPKVCCLNVADTIQWNRQ